MGWLVASAAASGGPPPLVLPFVHSGMERVMPKGRALPKLGETGGAACVLDSWTAFCLMTCECNPVRCSSRRSHVLLIRSRLAAPTFTTPTHCTICFQTVYHCRPGAAHPGGGAGPR